MAFTLTRIVIRILMGLVARIEVGGIENLPQSGGYIVAANHLGRLDVPLIYHLLDRKDIILLVAEKYQNYAFFRFLVKQMDAIWLNRFNTDFHALRIALERLRKGGVLVIAPEGTRSPTGALIAGHPGASYLAAKAGLPVIPVAVSGTQDKIVASKLRRLQRPQVIVRIGAPFKLPPLKAKERDQALHLATDEIMCQIAALLPETYRGVYRDHPRLRKLLSEAHSES